MLGPSGKHILRPPPAELEIPRLDVSQRDSRWPNENGRPRLSHPPSFQLLASALARRLRLGHPFRHLRFDCIKVEARALLHRREIEEGLEFLANYLLDEHEAPELGT